MEKNSDLCLSLFFSFRKIVNTQNRECKENRQIMTKDNALNTLLLPHITKNRNMIKLPVAYSPSPFRARNPTLPVGIKRYKVKEKDTFNSLYGKYNQLIFLMQGKAVVNSSEGLGQLVEEKQFFFLPVSAEMTLEALKNCTLVLFYFDQLRNSCDMVYFRDLAEIRSQTPYSFHAYPMQQPLPRFAHEMLTCFRPLMTTPLFQYIKHEEFLYLLRSLYSKQEMAAIFHPIVGDALEFRQFILSNYLKVKNITELVQLSGLRRKTFDRQFAEEFDAPPYQWILSRKAKHIYYALSETSDQMKDIMHKYGFRIAPHFTRFCKEYFDNTPLELRRRLRIAKMHTEY